MKPFVEAVFSHVLHYQCIVINYVLCFGNKHSNITLVKETSRDLYVLELPGSWLEVSVYPENPATGHFDTDWS
jgi:hypothetical protein